MNLVILNGLWKISQREIPSIAEALAYSPQPISPIADHSVTVR